jgi:hypothetical protein
MPFDAPVELPVTIRVIDEMLDIFGAQGEHWLQGKQADRKGNRCMIGALKLARRRIKARDDSTDRLIINAIRQVGGVKQYLQIPLFDPIVSFNDTRGRTFDNVRQVLLRARSHACRTCYL